jgi:hypothetical protein
MTDIKRPLEISPPPTHLFDAIFEVEVPFDV